METKLRNTSNFHLKAKLFFLAKRCNFTVTTFLQNYSYLVSKFGFKGHSYRNRYTLCSKYFNI